MKSLRCHLLLATALAAAAATPAAAQTSPPPAQRDDAGDDSDDEASGPKPLVRVRLSTSTALYSESASEVVNENDQASSQNLMFTDVRGRAHIENGGHSGWGGVGDFRLRLTPDELSARGYTGGREYNLRELSAHHESATKRVSFGRQVIRDVDATRIDGVSVVVHPRRRWHYGGFAGLYPNPLSRSLDTDYRSGHALLEMPAAGGTWVGYRSARVYGALGVAAVAPRDDDLASPEPVRAFVTSNGYARVSGDIDLFHSFVGDAAGSAGAQLTSAQLGANWRPTTWLRVESAYSHMSTYALEIYVRDLLETEDAAAEAGAPLQNNLAVIRLGSDSARLGVNVSLPARVNTHAQVRVRQRKTLLDADVPMDVAGLGADRQIELSGGIRQRKSILGLDLAANAVAIRGERTRTVYTTSRIRRGLWRQRVHAELASTYIRYADRCDPRGDDPTCTGATRGNTLRGGGTLVFVPNRHWMVLSDYRLARNRARSGDGALPTIVSHSMFVRARYAF